MQQQRARDFSRALLRACAILPLAAALAAQEPVTRAQAVAAALAHGSRVAVARADSASSAAQVVGASALENPTISGTYTKDTPQYHALIDWPIPVPWHRPVKIRAAEEMRRAAHYRLAYERAATGYDADTMYTRALAARAQLELSTSDAAAADSLQRMTERRRDAGDASELDVQLAALEAGSRVAKAAEDSLSFVAAVLDLQTMMGLPDDSVRVALADTLAIPLDSMRAVPPSAIGVRLALDSMNAQRAPLQIASAMASYRSTSYALSAARRRVIASPGLQAGFDTHDPDTGGNKNRLLPVFGISLPLPLLDRNAGEIADAKAERERAQAELLAARLESSAQIAHATRERTLAYSAVARDTALVTRARAVARMSLTAYQEGASTLPNVLEAQRNARDVIAGYIDDLARAWIASATVRLVTLSDEEAP